MISDRKRAARRIKPVDGPPLKQYRWWQLFSRTLFHLDLVDESGQRSSWSIDVRLGGDENGDVLAKLYRDGQHQFTSTLPAAFPVPGGTIEVVSSGFGLKRCHFVADDGTSRPLMPDPASAEGRRARLDRAHPAVGRTIGFGSIAILLVALFLGVPQLVQQITEIPPIAENIGTFTSPFQLSTGFNLALTVGAVLASTERALRLRFNRVLDGGLFDGID